MASADSTLARRCQIPVHTSGLSMAAEFSRRRQRSVIGLSHELPFAFRPHPIQISRGKLRD